MQILLHLLSFFDCFLLLDFFFFFIFFSQCKFSVRKRGEREKERERVQTTDKLIIATKYLVLKTSKSLWCNKCPRSHDLKWWNHVTQVWPVTGFQGPVHWIEQRQRRFKNDELWHFNAGITLFCVSINFHELLYLHNFKDPPPPKKKDKDIFKYRYTFKNAIFCVKYLYSKHFLHH